MLAKVIAWGPNRSFAARALKDALDNYHLIGVKTNRDFLRHILVHEKYLQHDFDTNYIQSNEDLLQRPLRAADKRISAIAVFALLQQRQTTITQHLETNSPWQAYDNWRLNEDHAEKISLNLDGAEIIAFVNHNEPSWEITIAGEQFNLSGSLEQQQLQVNVDNYCAQAVCFIDRHEINLVIAGEQYNFIIPTSDIHAPTIQDKDSLTSPMPGTITALFVQTGTAVKAGEKLLSMEAMKMEHTIYAPHDGKVKAVFYHQGDLVEEGVELISLATEKEDS